MKASDFGSRCTDKRYIAWLNTICRHDHDKTAVAAALVITPPLYYCSKPMYCQCDIATQSIASTSMDPHRCARVLKLTEDFIHRGDWIINSVILLLERCIRPGTTVWGHSDVMRALTVFR